MATYPAPLAGQRITASLLTSMQPLIVVKTADESVISTVTLQNDNELVLPVVANATYLLEGCLFFSSATGADFTFDFAFPSGTTLKWSAFALNANADAFGSGSMVTLALDDGADYTIGGSGTTNILTAEPNGLVIVSSTAGNLQLRFAQNGSTASNTTVYAKSWMKLTRYA